MHTEADAIGEWNSGEAIAAGNRRDRKRSSTAAREVAGDGSPYDRDVDATICNCLHYIAFTFAERLEADELCSVSRADERQRRRSKIFFQNLQTDALSVQMLILERGYLKM